MANQPSTPPTPPELTELLHCLEQLRPNEGTRRLQVDLARDAALELNAHLQKRIRKVQSRLIRWEKKYRSLSRRWRNLLRDLADGPTRFLAPHGWTPLSSIELEQLFDQLANRDFIAAANLLRDASGGRSSQCLRLLVDEVLLRGRIILVEYLTEQGNPGRTRETMTSFLDRLRHHLSGKLNHALAAQTAYQMTPEVATQLTQVFQDSLRLLLGLLLSDSPLRLVVPAKGKPFDPELHEIAPGRPQPPDPVVAGVLFPGLRSYAGTPSVLRRPRILLGIREKPDQR